MKLLASTAVTLLLVLIPCQPVIAQTASMPIPSAVFTDGDGKVFGPTSDGLYTLLNVEGRFFKIQVSPQGPAISGGATFFYQDPGCSGQVWFALIDQSDGVTYNQLAWIQGPDSVNGTYLLWMASETETPVIGMFYFIGTYSGTCDRSQTVARFLPVYPVDPNPLDGFHGPSVTFPDRYWTLEGGTKISQP